MLFQPVVRELVVFLCQFPDMSAVSSLFWLLRKEGVCKIREMKLQNV